MTTETRQPKLIFILEDRDVLRENLHHLLKVRGFRVADAADLDEARRILKELPEGPDVMLLDMHLKQPRVTGADLGIEVKNREERWPPEFLIHSGYDEVDYYQIAFRLGAATYLRKAEHPPEEVVRHVRALALRRALRDPGLAEEIKRIAQATTDRAVAIESFCRDILCPELEMTLGSRFVLLLTLDGVTKPLGAPLDWPENSRALEKIQKAVYGQLPSGTWVFRGPVPTGEAEEQPPGGGVIAQLDKAAFISLADLKGLRLSLGILNQDKGRPFPEDAEKLAGILGIYLSATVVDNLFELTTALASLAAERRALLLETTAAACTYLGQELAAVGWAAETVPELQRELRKVHAVGEELSDAGQMLKCVTIPADLRPPTAVAMRALVESSWANLARRLPEECRGLLRIEGTCEVHGQPDQLEAAVSRTLQWFAQRRIETPPGQEPAIGVECRAEPGWAEIRFEDRSRRLPAALRKRLFAPFAQQVSGQWGGEPVDRGRRLGLYLVKALVEGEAGATLEDRSDDLEGEVGHRFVMRFPAGVVSDATSGV